MNERLVEDWLTRANERSYQTPFAQALLAEGMRVLRVGHSPHEHGKDIIAVDKAGNVHAYQLKDGDLDLKSFERGLGQLTALVETEVEHPGIVRRARHQPWLVVSGQISIPAEDRIRVHNLHWKRRRCTPLKVIVGRELLLSFSRMAEDFWPQKPEDSRNLLALYLADGNGTLDRPAFARLIDEVLTVKSTTNKAEVVRRMAAANLFASYALASFYASTNHWELVQGWTMTAARIAWAADKARLAPKIWRATFRLAVDAAKAALDQLCDEALTPEALYPSGFELDELTRSRCTVCAGAIAAKVLIERENSRWDRELRARELLEDLFIRGRLFLWGESAVPLFLMQLWARDKLRADQSADGILFGVLSAVTIVNSRIDGPKLPSPYDSADEANAKALRRAFDGEQAMDLQSAASYTLEPLVCLMARRLWRNTLAPLWPRITKIDLIRLVPDKPRDLLLWDWRHRHGTNQSRRFPSPQSWRELLHDARTDEARSVPSVIRDEFDFAVLFAMCFPHRLTRPVVKHLDDVVRAL